MNLDCCARIRAAGRIGCTAIVVLLTMLQPACLPADDVEYKWGPPLLSDDGSTVIKFASLGGDHLAGTGGPIGFFGPDGQQRAVVVRDSLWGTEMSEDGYLAVWGHAPDRQKWYVALYDPCGKLKWERQFVPKDEPYSAAATGKGARVFVAMQLVNGTLEDSHWITVIDSAGKTTKNVKLEKGIGVGTMQVLGDRVLMVPTNDDLRAYSSDERINELWRDHSTEHTIFYGFAATPDMGQIAVLDGVRVKTGEHVEHPPRLRILDAKTGKLIKQQSLDLSQADLDAYHPLRYRKEDGSLAIKLRKGEERIDMSDDPEDPK